MNAQKMNIDLKENFSVTRKKRSQEYLFGLNRIIQEHVNIVPTSLAPKLIFVAGQPGAGKTALIKRVQKDYPDETFVIVDIDNYRLYHPDFNEVKNHKRDFIIYTNSFLFDIEEDVLLDAFQKRKNVIYVGTLRDTDFVCNFIIKNARKNNYHIGVYLLAVPLIVSLLSAVERYEEQIKSNASVIHFIDADFHHAANQGLEHTLNCLQADSLVDFFKLCLRGKTKEILPEVINCNSDIIQSLHEARASVFLDKKDIWTRLKIIELTQKTRDICEKEADTLKTLFYLFENNF